MLLFIQWIRSCFYYRSNIADIIKIIETDIVKLGREEQKQFLSFSIEVFQNSFLLKTGLKNNNLLEDTDPTFRNNFPNYITENNIEKIYKEIDKSILHIERNGNAKIVFLDLSIQLGFLLMSN
jgi:DNA polymerase-3 subunit delta'